MGGYTINLPYKSGYNPGVREYSRVSIPLNDIDQTIWQELDEDCSGGIGAQSLRLIWWEVPRYTPAVSVYPEDSGYVYEDDAGFLIDGVCTQEAFNNLCSEFSERGLIVLQEHGYLEAVDFDTYYGKKSGM
jgi:hypothetical protein